MGCILNMVNVWQGMTAVPQICVAGYLYCMMYKVNEVSYFSMLYTILETSLQALVCR